MQFTEFDDTLRLPMAWKHSRPGHPGRLVTLTTLATLTQQRNV